MLPAPLYHPRMSQAKENLLRAAIALFNRLPLNTRRRIEQRILRFKRPMTLGVRAAVFDRQGRVLLLRHTYKPGWMFPGGGVEKGETALQALTHELRDEAGIRLLARPRPFGIYANHAIFPNDHVLLYVLHPGEYERQPWQPNHEIAEIGFFGPDALPDATTPGTRRRLREILDGIPPTDEW